jgi:hypothetical protein
MNKPELIEGSEVFYKIHGYPNYAITKGGIVYALPRVVVTCRGHIQRRKGKIISQYAHRLGYTFTGVAPRHVLTHRLMAMAFLGAEGDFEVDHIDGNRANNALSNLRLCSRPQNMTNRKCANKTGVRGVYFNAKTGRYHAYIASNGRRTYLGGFECRNAAGRAYDRAARELHGEFATLNFN